MDAFLKSSARAAWFAAKKKGVTYSRSTTGIEMPKNNAFRHARWDVPSNAVFH
jgi:hypothetical protein